MGRTVVVPVPEVAGAVSPACVAQNGGGECMGATGGAVGRRSCTRCKVELNIMFNISFNSDPSTIKASLQS